MELGSLAIGFLRVHFCIQCALHNVDGLGYTYQYDAQIESTVKAEDVDGYPDSTWDQNNPMKHRDLCRHWCNCNRDCTSVDFNDGNGECKYHLGSIDWDGSNGGDKWKTGGGNYHMRKMKNCVDNTDLTFDSLPDSAFEASSVYTGDTIQGPYYAYKSRLSNPQGWYADVTQTGDVWIQVTFNEIRLVSAIETLASAQNCSTCIGEGWSKKVNIYYRTSLQHKWKSYMMYGVSIVEELDTNGDDHKIVTNNIQIPFEALQVKMVIIDHQDFYGTRWDMRTCQFKPDPKVGSQQSSLRLGMDQAGNVSPSETLYVRSRIQCNSECSRRGHHAFNYQYNVANGQKHLCECIYNKCAPLVTRHGFQYFEKND
ncbi:unnamed protein product [Owenia fusiformis]|uniref:Uncharacterized protein n=1 Tax=Owenia fusiformis TaxID=6347 RepID=A0A8J1TWE4_OWEFU|nr:unnamed protein product [Owenia fusiformis]